MRNIRKYSILIILAIYFLSSTLLSWQDKTVEERNSTKTIYLIKSYWHVGILIEMDSTAITGVPVLSRFDNYRFVDIGWGDEDFYQNPDTDYYNAAKAILFPTRSVIKVTGHQSEVASIIRWSDFCIKINVTDDQFEKLLEQQNESCPT